MSKYLSEEIAAEKSNAKSSSASQLESLGWKVEGDAAEIKISKQHGNEKIVVQLNVNHTVNSAEPDTMEGNEEDAPPPEMKSKPNFEVDIVKGDTTLSFSCAYLYEHDSEEADARQDGYEDIFAIEEVTLYKTKEEWSDKMYAVAGDILDGGLYDLFLTMLEERGVNKDFAEKMSDFCSAYEHAQYIKLLEGLEQFVK